MEQDATRPPSTFDTPELLTVWSVIAGRRSSYDSMMWQTPALGMAAQAFLLTLSLAPGTSGLARVTTAVLSMVISIMVLQLLAKHRRNEMLDTLTLEELEGRMGFADAAGIHPHSRSRYPAEYLDRVDRSAKGFLLAPKRFWAMSSFKLWCFGQYLFILIALGIVTIVLIGQGGILNS